MKKYLTICLFTCAIKTFAQTNQEKYKFTNEINQKLEADTTPWKYQIAATDYTFVNQYALTLKTWEQQPHYRPAKNAPTDSVLFVNSRKINAKDYIINRSANEQIIIINEAHHVPKHRTFTRSLLKDLYQNGYRYLGLEALNDSFINTRKYPTSSSGFYTNEPEFGLLLKEALDIGFVVFGYEATAGKNGKDREIEQANNIQQFLNNNPPGKTLIHCGFAHAYENEYPNWGKAMAGRLKENLNIDPFTIDQTLYLEQSDAEKNPLLLQLNTLGIPVILEDNQKNIFNGNATIKQTDVVVLHPVTTYTDNKPDWYTANKKSYMIPFGNYSQLNTALVFAYRLNEFEQQGVPVDIVEVTNQKQDYKLHLPKGQYEIVIKNQQHQAVNQYYIQIK